MNTDLLYGIENHFQWPSNIIVIDLQHEKLFFHTIYYRPWNPEPEVHSEEYRFPLPMLEMQIKQLLQKEIPVILLTNMSFLHGEVFNALSALDIQAIMCSEQGYMLGMEILDNSPPFDTANQTQLEIISDERTVIKDVNLPWKGKIECSTNDIIFEVKIISEDKVLSGYFRTRESLQALEISVKHQISKDTMEALGTTTAGQVIRLPFAKKSKQTQQYIQDVNLIFDRTCVDDAKWGDALLLHMNYDASFQDTSTLNEEIRRGTIEGVQRAFQAENPRLSVWCVNDIHDALAFPSWLNAVPQTTISSEINRPIEEVQQLLLNATWLPGYDIWDPIGEALLQAVEHAKKTSSPIVIIGDSPPFPSGAQTDPINEIRTVFGFQTVVRRYSDAWRRALQEAQDHQLPIVYIFLTHYKEHSSLQEEAWTKTNAIEQAICKALAKEPIHLVKEPATFDGVQRAIQRAKSVMFHQKTQKVIRMVR